MRNFFCVISKDVSSVVKKSPFVVLIIVFGIAAAILTHIIVFEYISEFISKKKVSARYSTYSFTHISSDDLKTIDSLIKNDNVENAFIIFMPDKGDSYVVGWCGEGASKYFALSDGRFLLNGESDKAYTSAALCEYNADVPRTVELFGKSYDVVGSTKIMIYGLLEGLSAEVRHSYPQRDKYIIVDFSEMKNAVFTDALVRFSLRKSCKNSAEVIGRISDEFAPGIDVEEPPDFLRENIAKYMFYFAVVSVICFLSFMNIVGLYWYILKIQKRKYMIYKILGASDSVVLKVILVKYLFMFVTAGGLAILFSIITRRALSLIYIEFTLDAGVIGIIFLSDMLITLFVSLRKVITISNDTSIKII